MSKNTRSKLQNIIKQKMRLLTNQKTKEGIVVMYGGCNAAEYNA